MPAFDNRRDRAAWFGVYASLAATSRTRCLVSNRARKAGSSLSTRDTTDIETPAALATSSSVVMVAKCSDVGRRGTGLYRNRLFGRFGIVAAAAWGERGALEAPSGGIRRALLFVAFRAFQSTYPTCESNGRGRR
jgi:hypothetical protein